MAIGKFVVLTPDRWVTGLGKTAADSTLARFGHLNRIVDYINEHVEEKMLRTINLSASATAELYREVDPVLLVIPETNFLTGATNYLIPLSSNCTWSVTVDFTAACSTAGGTVAVGDSFLGKYTVLYKRVNGTASIVGINGAVTVADASMSTSQVLFTAGASQDLRITFKAPSTASSTGFKLRADVYFTELTF
jgi:hypothetical protein